MIEGFFGVIVFFSYVVYSRLSSMAACLENISQSLQTISLNIEHEANDKIWAKDRRKIIKNREKWEHGDNNWMKSKLRDALIKEELLDEDDEEAPLNKWYNERMKDV